MSTPETPGSVYAVIPASVLYDSSLRPNAKLLYGEISALTQKEGYCWAENARFAEALGVSNKTVEALVRQLKDAGHIQVEVVRDPRSNEVISRKIWLVGSVGIYTPPSPQKRGDLPSKTRRPPLEIEGTSPQNRGVYIGENTKENTEERGKGKKPSLPPDILDCISDYTGQDEELQSALVDFALNRAAPPKPNPVKTSSAMYRLLTTLDRLSEQRREVKLAMINKSIERNWSGFFKLDPDEVQDACKKVKAVQEDEEGIDGI